MMQHTDKEKILNIEVQIVLTNDIYAKDSRKIINELSKSFKDTLKLRLDDLFI
jgi:hypothetical protein